MATKNTSKRKPFEERNMTTSRYREEDEAEGIRDIKVPSKGAKSGKATAKTAKK